MQILENRERPGYIKINRKIEKTSIFMETQKPEKKRNQNQNQI